MIRTTWHERVAQITIDRPDRSNALDTDHCRALSDALASAIDAGGRVVVLAGEGKAFCAGADLQDVSTSEFRESLWHLLQSLTAAPVPIIAAIEGAALGAGSQLAVAVDLRVVGPHARFGVPAAKLGLAVDQWTVRRIVAIAGGSTARALLLGGVEVDAETALRVGFAHRAGGVQEALAWATELSRLAPLTLRAHKAALEDGRDADAYIRAAWESADFAEGIAAFRERRPPEFKGR